MSLRERIATNLFTFIHTDRQTMRRSTCKKGAEGLTYKGIVLKQYVGLDYIRKKQAYCFNNRNNIVFSVGFP